MGATGTFCVLSVRLTYVIRFSRFVQTTISCVNIYCKNCIFDCDLGPKIISEMISWQGEGIPLNPSRRLVLMHIFIISPLILSTGIFHATGWLMNVRMTNVNISYRKK